MIFKEGWRPVRDLYFAGLTIARQLTDPKQPDAADQIDTSKNMNDAMRAIATKLPKFGILLANGEVLEGSNRLLDGVWKGAVTRHVSLNYSTLGSGYILNEIAKLDHQAQERELRLNYGPFLGHTVLMRDEDYVSATIEAFPWVTELFPLNNEQKAKLEQSLQLDEPKRRRGHPKLYDGLIEIMVQREYKPRVMPGGDLAEATKDHVIQDARVWIESLTGKPIPEGTMKSYIRPLYPPDLKGRSKKVDN